jgi:hypothetical protein
MRDIRGDLQLRADLIKEKMNASKRQFEKYTEQLTLEHQSRLTEIKSELEAVKLLMEAERRRAGSSGSAMPQPENLPRLPSVQDMTTLRPAVKLAS